MAFYSTKCRYKIDIELYSWTLVIRLYVLHIQPQMLCLMDGPLVVELLQDNGKTPVPGSSWFP